MLSVILLAWPCVVIELKENGYRCKQREYFHVSAQSSLEMYFGYLRHFSFFPSANLGMTDSRFVDICGNIVSEVLSVSVWLSVSLWILDWFGVLARRAL